MIGNIILLSATFGLIAVSAALGAEAGQVFPEIVGKALTGDEFHAPADLSGDYNLVLVAFLREQQQDVDTWVPLAESVADSDSTFAYSEFPILPEMNRVARWFIYSGMRSGIASEEARARTVTFHLDKQAFRSRLGIESEEYISAFLVDREGRLLWRGRGKLDGENERGLRRALQEKGGAGRVGGQTPEEKETAED